MISLDMLRDAAFKKVTHDFSSTKNLKLDELRACIIKGRLFVVDEALPFDPDVIKMYFGEKTVSHPYGSYVICRNLNGLRVLVLVVLAESTQFQVIPFSKTEYGLHTGMVIRVKGSTDFISADCTLLKTTDPTKMTEQYNAASSNFVSYVFQVIHALSSKGVQQIIVEPTRAERQSRLARNKPKVGAYRRIIYATPVEQREVLVAKYGGTHASPVPHERRGHYVTRGVKTYWRRSCTVNAKVGTPGAPGLPARTHYEVSV